MAGLVRLVRMAVMGVVVLAGIIVAAIPSHGQQVVGLSRGQTVYVPVYSHIYIGDKETPFYLAVTVSIRNTDQASPINITDVDYYDTNGKLIKKYLDKPVQLGANGSTRFVVKESDDKGGSGANFIVKWNTDRQVNTPIVESVMIGTRYQQGISFASRGQVIAETGWQGKKK